MARRQGTSFELNEVIEYRTGRANAPARRGPIHNSPQAAVSRGVRVCRPKSALRNNAKPTARKGFIKGWKKTETVNKQL